ncbi:MAG TPA: NBR1-Ig-like domain-containing protein [Anaerolineae bacterium]|nr:NBR1-Ig-like domain-containing protein [Anaerolineae bacterium]
MMMRFICLYVGIVCLGLSLVGCGGEEGGEVVATATVVGSDGVTALPVVTTSPLVTAEATVVAPVVETVSATAEPPILTASYRYEGIQFDYLLEWTPHITPTIQWPRPMTATNEPLFWSGQPDVALFEWGRLPEWPRSLRPSTLQVWTIRDEAGNFYPYLEPALRQRVENLIARRTSGAVPDHYGQRLEGDWGWGERSLVYFEPTPARPFIEQDVHYLFEGMVGNGRYYIWFNYDIVTGVLADEPTIPEGWGSTIGTDFEAYVAQSWGLLTQVDSQQFQPTLATLDKIAASVKVDETLFDPPFSLPGSPPDCVDSATFVADVDVPDGTQFGPDELFYKTWRMLNSGSCRWDASYGFTLIGVNNPIEWVSQEPLPVVAPGEEVDVRFRLRAPAVLGEATNYWQFMTPLAKGGQPFGDALFTQIEVVLRDAEGNVVEPLTAIPGHGLVRGALAHPEGEVPPLTLYFVNQESGETVTFATEKGWDSYEVAVPRGNYWVYARPTELSAPLFWGGYTEWVGCGSTLCDNHALKRVRVPLGLAAEGIDIIDWEVPLESLPVAGE